MYDKIKWKQDNITAGLGIESMLEHSGLGSSPKGMRFNSIYFIMNYSIEEDWSAYTKLGVSYSSDNENLFVDNSGIYYGFGIDKNHDDQFHTRWGYHISYSGEYSYSRFILTFIKHFELDDE